MIAIESKGARDFARLLRQQFLNRIRERGIVSGSELIRVHRVAQERRIAPEDAVVLLGLLSEEEVLDILMEGSPTDVTREFARAC